jgi:outer membrane protein
MADRRYEIGKTVKHSLISALLTSALALGAAPALAQSKGDWTVGFGVGNINPKSDNGTIAGFDVDVDDATRPIFTLEYFVFDNIGVELLASTPFKHDISLDGSELADTKHLPPTLSLNYHFPTQSVWKPYVGAGVNYTIFWDENLDIGDLDLDNSWGFAVQAGLDYQFRENGAFRFNVRYIDIDADAKVNGSNAGTANIDPVIFSVSYVHKF